MACPFCAMGLPRPHSEVNTKQLNAKARSLSLSCHPDKQGGNTEAYLFLVTCKEECERRMRENDTTCYLEQAPDQRRGSNKQPAAAGGQRCKHSGRAALHTPMEVMASPALNPEGCRLPPILQPEPFRCVSLPIKRPAFPCPALVLASPHKPCSRGGRGTVVPKRRCCVPW